MSLGGGYQQSKSKSEQNSGLLAADKGGASTLAASLMPQVGGSMMNFMNSPLPDFSTGKYGVGPQFDSAITQIGNDMFNKASGTAGSRGFLSPENLGGVIGSAVQNASPQLAQFANQAQQNQLFGPDQIMAQRYGTSNNFLTSLAQLMGSSGSASSSSFGFSGQGGTTPTKQM